MSRNEWPLDIRYWARRCFRFNQGWRIYSPVLGQLAQSALLTGALFGVGNSGSVKRKGEIDEMSTIENKQVNAPTGARALGGLSSSKYVFSKDGTAIAFSRIGHGLPVILVDGALCYRGMGNSGGLAKLLAPHFTVFTYDRRGRGNSADTKPYAVVREVEDIDALLCEAGGAAYVWGMSSGAVLALDAAAHLTGIKKLALYEAPFIVDNSRDTTENDWIRIGEAVDADRRSDAVTLFLTSVGVPGLFRTLLRWMPAWPKLKAIAHTLPYDGAIVRNDQRGQPLSTSQWASVKIPTLVMDGEKSPAWIRNANRSLAAVLPSARYRTLAGQTHMLKPLAHAPTLVGFFNC